MGAVAFAWELGNNLGHIARDLPVALALRARGHSVYFASRNLGQANEVLAPLAFTCVQAPRLILPRLPFTPSSYAEILLANGYGNVSAVNLLVAAWQRVIKDRNADIVICNHAPSAALASHCADIPMVATCIGFELPPVSPQAFRTWDPPPVKRVMAAEQLVCKTTSQALTGSGRASIESIAELFQSTSVLMTTFPELDHYGPREGLEYVGPVSHLPSRPYDWPTGLRKRVFAYLRRTVPNIEAILSGLALSSFDTLCVMPDHSPAELQKHEGRRFRMQRNTVDISSALEGCDLVVTYGTGTIHEALLAGRPLLMCPQNAEQYMVSSQVVRLGAGLMLPVGASATAIADTISILLSDPSFSGAARAFAEGYAAFSSDSAIAKIVNVIESRL